MIYFISTTIKIPLHRLKRDSFERPEKSPLQLQIESELSRRRERDAPYEDITEVSNHKKVDALILIDLFFFSVHINHSQDHYHLNFSKDYHYQLTIIVIIVIIQFHNLDQDSADALDVVVEYLSIELDSIDDLHHYIQMINKICIQMLLTNLIWILKVMILIMNLMLWIIGKINT